MSHPTNTKSISLENHQLQLTEKQWQEKLELFKKYYSHCQLCPMKCQADRDKNKPGMCGALKDVKIASFNLHTGEEPPISGTQGSGTVFFSGCTLRCIYCQNYPISHLFHGQFYSINELADIFLNLEKRGSHNINLVTATPYLYHFVHALYLARQNGLTIPVVYNTSGYERSEIIEALHPLIDIYLPDLKYVSSEISKKYTGVNNYFEYAYANAVLMYKLGGYLKTDKKGIAQKGFILRHLVLPSHINNSKKVLKVLSKSPMKNCQLSLMRQYFPAHKAHKYPEINRRLFINEYHQIKDYAEELGFTNGWFQDL